jgi:hypothetical protein
MIIGSFFLLRLFVAVVIQHYKATLKDDKVENGQHAMLTAEQARWIRMQEKMLSMAAKTKEELKPPSWLCPLNRLAFELAYGCGANAMATVVYTCIIANTVLMASLHFGQTQVSQRLATALRSCNKRLYAAAIRSFSECCTQPRLPMQLTDFYFYCPYN